MTKYSILPGPNNRISDVDGVKVGHTQNLRGTARTGVTAIRFHDGNHYLKRPFAGCAIINGFSKALGLTQLAELGEIETPLLLTNTFGVHACAQELIACAIAENPRIGRGHPTVNPLVLECNDGSVNDIQKIGVDRQMARDALQACAPDVEQGTVGAGTGMRTFGHAGGIGTASRRVHIEDAGNFTIGALVLANFGDPRQMRDKEGGLRLGELPHVEDKGSIVIVIAVDAPLNSNQLSRVARRSAAGLGRLGSFYGHGSGDIAVAVSTKNMTDYSAQRSVTPAEHLRNDRLDGFFLATADLVEEAVINALNTSVPFEGWDGSILPKFGVQPAETQHPVSQVRQAKFK
tara:strand:- start:11191 stop:12231 length:1041 start_codon:yes stop_codon:yes gene_type:complete